MANRRTSRIIATAYFHNVNALPSYHCCSCGCSFLCNWFIIVLALTSSNVHIELNVHECEICNRNANTICYWNALHMRCSTLFALPYTQQCTCTHAQCSWIQYMCQRWKDNDPLPQLTWSVFHEPHAVTWQHVTWWHAHLSPGLCRCDLPFTSSLSRTLAGGCLALTRSSTLPPSSLSSTSTLHWCECAVLLLMNSLLVHMNGRT